MIWLVGVDKLGDVAETAKDIDRAADAVKAAYLASKSVRIVAGRKRAVAQCVDRHLRAYGRPAQRRAGAP